MKQKGSIKIILALVVLVIGIVGYLYYKNTKIIPQIAPKTINGHKVVIDVKENGEQVGTMILPEGWEANPYSSNEGDVMPGEPIRKFINIQNQDGDYSIKIESLGSGRAVCGKSEDGKMDKIANGYINFKDNSGYEYFRQKYNASELTDELEICSNGQNGKGSELFNSDEAAFGDIIYRVPNKPEEKILKQMDDIVAAFSENTITESGLVGIWQSSGSMASGWSDRYHFYSDGKFHFYPNQMICKNEKEELLGTWKIDNDSLTLSINSKTVIFLKCGDDGSSVELSRKSIALEKSETKVIKYSYLGILKNDTYPSMKLSGTQFWKFSDDPATYGDEQFPLE